MTQKSKMLQAIVIGVVMAAAIIGGVTLTQQNFFTSLSSESTTRQSGATGTLAAQITDPPNLPDGVTHVFINYSDIQVHAAGVPLNSGWYTVANSGVVDLMSVVNVSMTLGSAPVSSGLFTLVKFDIANSWITYFGKNDSAVVPLNQISVPIANGGVYVAANASSGFLIDISPTVVPYQNATQTSFVLVPATTSLPISSNIWHKGLEHTGSIIDLNSSSWLHNSNNGEIQNITILNPSLSASSLQLTVKNTGNVNTTLTSISILAPTSSGTVTGDGVTSGHAVGIFWSTIAVFQILSNGTVIQPNHSDDYNQPDDYTGLSVSPGLSVNLSYSGTIVTLNIVGETTSIFNVHITAGSGYEIKVTTSLGTSATYLVMAS